MAAYLGRKLIISASILLIRKAWLGSKLGDLGSRNPFSSLGRFQIDAGLENPRWLTHTV